MPKSTQHSQQCDSSCRCNNKGNSRWSIWCHRQRALRERQAEQQQQHDAHFQADASSLGATFSGGHPQLDAPGPSFDFNLSLPLVDPPAAFDSLQSPEDAHTKVSGRSLDDILLNLHTQTHRTSDDSDDEDLEDTPEAADIIDPETSDFWDGDDVDMEDDMDPCEGIVSDWDILAEEFIMEAEGLGKFEHSFLHTP